MTDRNPEKKRVRERRESSVELFTGKQQIDKQLEQVGFNNEIKYVILIIFFSTSISS